MGVLPGVGFALPFVASHSCVPPLGVVMLRGPERMGASYIVVVSPSMRRFTKFELG